MKKIILGILIFHILPLRSLELDLQKVRRYDRDFYFSHPYQPFSRLISYKNKTNELYYVADRHAECQKTKERIDLALKKNPDLIVVEGLRRSWGVNPDNWDLKIQKKTGLNSCDIYYPLKRAKELKIDYAGTEPGKMKNFSSYERDLYFLISLKSFSEKYKKILVIYGSGHYVQQELVLNSFFGQPLAVY